ncbi:MAG: type I-D CRISPR-associated helicase Cas3' [Promethearchaeota archaeon]
MRKYLFPIQYLKKEKGSTLDVKDKSEKKIKTPFLHQEKTRELLLKNDIVANTNPTGSGKTRASLMIIDEFLKDCECYTDAWDDKKYKFFVILFVSPVNSLLNQTFIDIVEYVEENNLDYNIFPINGLSLKLLRRKMNVNSNGSVLENLFSDPIAYNSKIKAVASRLSNYNCQIKEGNPYIYVINPDILYYELFGIFYKKEATNIFNSFFNNVRYIIFDEFHYYTLEQLNSFFLILTFWKILGFFGDKSNGKIMRKICLLSATPNPLIEYAIVNVLNLRYEEINDDILLKKLKNQNIQIEEIPFQAGNILNISRITQIPPNFSEEIMNPNILKIIEDFLNKDKFGLIICNAKIHADYLYAKLSQKFPDKCGRITGSENDNDRQKAVNKQLVIATNTIDLGFNFRREQDSSRQNIDFIFFDFNTADEFIQRIGRGGRLLGKEIIDEPTYSYIFLSRKEFDQIIKDLDDVKNNNGNRKDYIDVFIQHFPQKNYYPEFFRKYGAIIIKSQLFKFKAHLRIPQQQNQLSQTDNNLTQYFQNMLKKLDDVECYLTKIYQIEAQNQLGAINSLSVLKNIVERIPNNDLINGFISLNKKAKASLIFNALYNSSFKLLKLKTLFEEFFFSLLQSVDGNIIEDLNYWQIKNNQYKDWLQNEIQENILEKEQNNIIPIIQKPSFKLYLKFIKLFFDQLFSNFRGGSFNRSSNGNLLSSQVDIIDEYNKLGSFQTEYDFFYIYKNFNYKIKHNNSKIQIIDLIKFPNKHRKIVFLLNMKDVDISDFENDNFLKKGVLRYLFRLIYFDENQLNLKIDDHSTPIPKKIYNLLSKDHIGFVIPEDYALLKYYNIERLQRFTLEVNFRNNITKKYFIFFGKNAFIIDSIINNVNNPNT